MSILNEVSDKQVLTALAGLVITLAAYFGKMFIARLDNINSSIQSINVVVAKLLSNQEHNEKMLDDHSERITHLERG